MRNTATSHTATSHRRKQLWLLGPYAATIHWFFEFVILTGVPILALGAAISVADLMTGGLLSHLSDGFNLVWAIGQAVAIELLFFTAFMRMAEMSHQGRWGKVIGWFIVGIILAIPSFQASVVYGEVHTFGITVQQAIAKMGISDMEWIIIRALAVVFVGALGGLAAYTPEGRHQSVEEQLAEMEAKAALAKANARLNEARATAWAKAVKGALRSTFASPDELHLHGEGGDHSHDPVEASARADEHADDATPSNVIPLRQREKNGKRVFSLAEARRFREARERGSAQSLVYAFLDRHPTASRTEVMAATGVGKTSASKHMRIWRERQAEAEITR